MIYNFILPKEKYIKYMGACSVLLGILVFILILFLLSPFIISSVGVSSVEGLCQNCLQCPGCANSSPGSGTCAGSGIDCTLPSWPNWIDNLWNDANPW